MYDDPSSATYQYDALDEPDPVFPEIDVTDYGRGDYVPFIDEVRVEHFAISERLIFPITSRILKILTEYMVSICCFES